jgi:hypothetical protein
VFGGGRFVEGVYQPLTLEGVQDALRLSDHRDDDPDEAGGALALA